MAGSYFQNHSFGISAIDLAEVTTTEKYLGSEVGLKSSKSYIDITRGKTYSLKQLLQMRKVQRLGGNLETITVTYGGTVTATEQAVTVDGVGLTVTPSAATPTGLATAVATAVNANDNLKKIWKATSSGTKLTLTAVKNTASIFDASNYGAGEASVEAAVAQTKWGANKVILSLYTTEDTAVEPVKILEMTATVGELADNGQTEYEITLPPNAKKYLMLGIKKENASDILTGKSVFPVIPNQG